jgi:hypothetical protein
MKNLDFQSTCFRQLTTGECQEFSGGGFAFDAGRFLRFLAISGGTVTGTPWAVMDFIANKYAQ